MDYLVVNGIPGFGRSMFRESIETQVSSDGLGPSCCGQMTLKPNLDESEL